MLRRLRGARLTAGITQVEAARALGRPQSFVSKCETGERRVDVLELLEFARLYERGLDYFVTGVEAGGPLVTGEKRGRYERTPRRRRRGR